MLNFLREAGHKQKALFIQLEPLDIYSQSNIEEYSVLNLRAASRPLFTPHTFVIDLKPQKKNYCNRFTQKPATT